MRRVLISLGLVAMVSAAAFAQSTLKVVVDCSPVKDADKKAKCETLNDGKTYADKASADAARAAVVEKLVAAGVPKADAEKGVSVK